MADKEEKKDEHVDSSEQEQSKESADPQEEVVDSSPKLSSEKTFPSSIRNIDRILDINLELTVKIGELGMSLQEILNLHSGSIIEIDKNADAPLDLQISGKVLAQGEVVTVGENLGLRVIRK